MDHLKSFINFKGSKDKVPKDAPKEIHENESGFIFPLEEEMIMNNKSRFQPLQQIWESCALPSDLYQEMYLTPIRKLLLSIQCVPATQSGRYANSNGFADLALLYTSCAVRLAQGYLLPAGGAPEEIAAHSTKWHAVIFWSALFYHLPLLQSLEGELISGRKWMPGLYVPHEAFRFRFCETLPDPEQRKKLSTLVAMQLLPGNAASWLFADRKALNCLIDNLSGDPSSCSVIEELLRQACREVESPLLTSSDSFKSNESYIHATGAEVLTNPKEGEYEIPSVDEALSHPKLNCDDQSDHKKKKSEGELFWDWLCLQLLEEGIEINKEGSRVHIITGFAFLAVPDVFYLYIKMNKLKVSRERIQSSFERLKYHHVSGSERFFKAKVFNTAGGTGTFKWSTGYLVRSSLLYQNSRLPDESELLILSVTDT